MLANALALTLPLAATSPPSEAEVKTLLPDAAEIRKVEASWSAEDLQAVARACGRSAAGEGVTVFSAKSAVGGEEKPRVVRSIFVPGRGPNGEFRLGLAVDARGTVQAARVFGDAGRAGSKEYLAQFVGPWATATLTENSWLAPETIEETRQAIQTSANEEDRKRRALLSLVGMMRRNNASVVLLPEVIGKNDDAALAAVRAMQANFDRMRRFPDLGALLPEKDLEGFSRLAEASLEVAKEIEAALVAKDAKKASELLEDKLTPACGRCHGWDDHKLRRPLESALRKERLRLGIGPGFFLVHHDIDPAGPGDAGKQSAQAVGFAVKEALLLLQKLRG